MPNGSSKEGLRPDQVPHVKLFLLFYWIMTGMHGLHVTHRHRRGCWRCSSWRGAAGSRRLYYSPVDVTALYWHFVDTVWIFLLPMLYLLGSHTF